MSIEHKSRKLKDLYEKIEKKEIVLPNFQRGFVWSFDEQQKLIASVIVKIPIGSTLHLMGKDDAFSARALCERESVTPSISECEYVLDGQQRLSTLKNAFYDVYDFSNWKKTWDNLFLYLRVRWFIQLNDKNDFFGLKTLYFNEKKILESEPREVLGSITFKKIMKTKDLDKWYHPSYTPKDENGNSITTIFRKKEHIAKAASQEKMIPLYEVYKGNEGIHKKVIEYIAKDQVEDLKATAKDKKSVSIEEYNNYVCDILKSFEPEISKNIDNITPKEIDELFDALANKWSTDFSTFLANLVMIDMPIILLEQKEAGRAAAIFEEINKGGTALSIYDLIVAKAANADSAQESLTDRIINLLGKSYPTPFKSIEWKPTCMTDIKDNMLTSKFQSIYLNALSILIAKSKNQKIEKTTISRNYVLSLSAQDINDNNVQVVETIIRAYSFLQFRCGVINEKNIIYDYMLLPIIFFLEDDKIWNDEKKINILEAWYWSWLFSGKYKERQDDQFVNDIEYLKELLESDKNPCIDDFLSDRLFNTPDYSDQETLIHTNKATDNIAPKAMKEGILQYVLSREPKDFLPNEERTLNANQAACNDEKENNRNCKKYKLQIHHIIPLGIATKIGEKTEEIRKNKEHILNSPLNLTYISECANNAISDKDYVDYKKELKDKITTHFLTLNEYSSKEDIESTLIDRYKMIKNILTYEITELIK